MDRKTRDRFAARTQADLTGGNACLETPRPMFEAIRDRLGPFDLDLTADAKRHHCPRWFGPGSPLNEFDALEAFWPSYGQSGFSNPPYGPFVQEILLWALTMSREGFTSVFLLPMRVTQSFRTIIIPHASDLLFCDARIPFFENGLPRLNERVWLEEGKARADGAMFDSIVVRFGPGHHGGPRVGEFAVPDCVTTEDLERAAELRRQKGVL
jgi:hypothetical protein